MPYPLPRSLVEVLSGCERIVVAGGLRDRRALEELAGLAPLAVVVSHKDYLEYGDQYPESLALELGGAKVFVTPMVGHPPDLLPPLQALLAHDPPDVVIHGHAPEARVQWVGGTLFVCPGRAAGPRPGRPGTCAILDVEGPGRITAHVLELS